jgi:hypothetical protein
MMKTLQLINKQIDIDNSDVLFNKPVTAENLKTDWETHNCLWTVENGWLTGKNPDESAGMAMLKEDFPGNILLEFEGRTVYPSTHDIDFLWNGEWQDSLNSCGVGYIGGLSGWWTGRTGIEKSPDYKLRATTNNFILEPGRTYKVQAGSIDGYCFMFVDGREIIAVQDPDPIDNLKYGKVAFTAWSSHIQIRNIVIRQISWKHVEMEYRPEF